MNLPLTSSHDKKVLPYITMLFVMLPQLLLSSRNFTSIFNNASLLLGSLIMFYVVNRLKFDDTRKDIFTSRKLLIPFLIVFALNIAYIITSQYTSVYSTVIIWIANNLIKLGIPIQNYDYLGFIIVLTSLFSIYFVGIGFGDFNWHMNKSEVKTVLMASIGRYFPLVLVCLFIYQTSPLRMPALGVIPFLILTGRTFLYPALYEEFIYRGLLFSLLQSFNISFNKINIIQALIFGFIHFSNIGTHFSFLSFIFTGFQVAAGYTLGVLYQRTKSLTPCILLHALIDMYIYFIK